MNGSRLIGGASLIAALFATWSASAAPPAAPQAAANVAVLIQNYHFEPSVLKVSAGTTITWTNKDDDVHTVMDAAGSFRSDALDSGQTYSVKFEKPGVYRIACSLHPQMSATITVE
jgi:plastocyanin